MYNFCGGADKECSYWFEAPILCWTNYRLAVSRFEGFAFRDEGLGTALKYQYKLPVCAVEALAGLHKTYGTHSREGFTQAPRALDPQLFELHSWA